MERITSKMLDAKTLRLNAALGRPVAAWTKTTASATKVNMRANVGHIFVDGYSPDGVWRGHVVVIMNEGGGEHQLASGNRRELWNYLDGVFAVVDSWRQWNTEFPEVKSKHREAA
jgi:hypothetical protein